MKKITVYIISHNYGKYLFDAIESVLRQVYQEWELLVFDDNSNDNTQEIINMYKNDPRVRTFKTKGVGLPAVANLALENSTGDLIIRLDGDDFFDENILLVLEAYLRKHPEVALVFPDYYLIDEGGHVIVHEKREKLIESNHLLDAPPNGACTLIRKKVLLEIGGYREDLGAQDGFDLWSKVKDKYGGMNVNLPLFYYRRHGQNLTNKSYRILNARRQIKKDAIKDQLKNYSPINAIIPCRKFYDFKEDLWDSKINGISLLERKLSLLSKSDLFDNIIVASDTEDVLSTINKYSDSRIKFFKRDLDETIRSRSLISTLYRISESYDEEFKGISVICYLPSPFVTLESIQESIYTLVLNDSDSSIGVEEIREPVFIRTPYGLKPINYLNGLKQRSDYDIIYVESNLAIASKNKNFKTGSIIGPTSVNFVVTPEERFFIDSEKKIQIAELLDK